MGRSGESLGELEGYVLRLRKDVANLESRKTQLYGKVNVEEEIKNKKLEFSELTERVNNKQSEMETLFKDQDFILKATLDESIKLLKNKEQLLIQGNNSKIFTSGALVDTMKKQKANITEAYQELSSVKKEVSRLKVRANEIVSETLTEKAHTEELLSSKFTEIREATEKLKLQKNKLETKREAIKTRHKALQIQEANHNQEYSKKMVIIQKNSDRVSRRLSNFEEKKIFIAKEQSNLSKALSSKAKELQQAKDSLTIREDEVRAREVILEKGIEDFKINKENFQTQNKKVMWEIGANERRGN